MYQLYSFLSKLQGLVLSITEQYPQILSDLFILILV